MFLVIEGKVNIVTYGTVLENVGMHGIFGEMALIESAPRSAAAIAVEPTGSGRHRQADLRRAPYATIRCSRST